MNVTYHLSRKQTSNRQIFVDWSVKRKLTCFIMQNNYQISCEHTVYKTELQ